MYPRTRYYYDSFHELIHNTGRYLIDTAVEDEIKVTLNTLPMLMDVHIVIRNSYLTYHKNYKLLLKMLRLKCLRSGELEQQRNMFQQLLCLPPYLKRAKNVESYYYCCTCEVSLLMIFMKPLEVKLLVKKNMVSLVPSAK